MKNKIKFCNKCGHYIMAGRLECGKDLGFHTDCECDHRELLEIKVPVEMKLGCISCGKTDEPLYCWDCR